MFPFQSEPETDQVTNDIDATVAPQPVTVPAPVRRTRRVGQAALIAAALAAGTAGGGAAGIFAANHWQAPRTSTSVVEAQPVRLTTQQAATIAGQVYNKVNGAVVEVKINGQSARGATTTGNGSGVIVDAHGLVLTNDHVVEGASSISVLFSTGEERPATVVGTDVGNDLAVVKVDLPANTPVATLGDSDQVQVGDPAVAIGSPFGLDQTVTEGIISAVHRTWWPGAGQVKRNLIQTDAAINPGNSGGPLLNAQGDVVGINSMIESPVRASVGVGFAIPINTAKQLLPKLESGSKLEPGYLGISAQAPGTGTGQSQAAPATNGVVVASVAQNGPAEQAGLQAGDTITAVDGAATADMNALSSAIGAHQPGEVITLTVVSGGKTQQIKVTLGQWPTSNLNQ